MLVKIPQYRSTDFIAPGPGKLQLVYTPEGGGDKTVLNVYDFKGRGVAMSMYNTDEVRQHFLFDIDVPTNPPHVQ